jgi:branched-chain amino acid transport system substrate-binding protein
LGCWRQLEVDRFIPATNEELPDKSIIIRIKKEVSELKKLLFISLAVVLALSVGLLGCEGEGEGEEDTRLPITIGIAGPMGQAQGKHHMYGAELAADEINGDDPTTDGVLVGSTLYKVELVEIDTNEVLSPSGADGVTAMSAEIDDVDFVFGGFRTEAVLNYREIAIGPTGADKLFIDVGAATEALTHSVLDDYTNYKYWFKGSPPNELFLSGANSKLIGMLVAAVQGASGNATYAPTIAFVAEDALWTLLSRTLAYASLGPGGSGYLVGGPDPFNPDDWMWTPNPVATVSEMDTILTDIAGYDPQIILTLMSGPCGVTYANRVGAFMPDVLTVGINVEAQRIGFPDVAQYAEGMIFLDSWAPGVNLTDQTADFLDAFETKTGEWPIYTAATYDAVKSLIETIDAEDTLVTADLIPAMEASVRLGTSGTTGYYPLWDDTTTGNHPFGPPLGFPATTAALNQDQVLTLYPWLTSAKYANAGNFTVDPWVYNADDWTMLPHTTHELVYGPEWVAPLASQWQTVGDELVKVGVWPKTYAAGLGMPTDQATWLGYLAGSPDFATVATAEALGLWDQYGWWHFEYPGTGTVDLAAWIGWLIAHHGV